MVGAVVQRGAQAHHGVAGERAVPDAVAQALLHGGEKVPGHRAAHHALAELQRLAAARLKLDPHVAVLPVPAGLLLVLALDLHLFADGLAVGHARGLQRDFDAELLLEPRGNHVQVLLPQAGKDHLVRLRVGAEADGRVLLLQAEDALRGLVFLPSVFGEHGHREGRGRVLDARQLHAAAGRAERVARADPLQLRHRADIPRRKARGVLLLLAAQEQRLADAQGLARADVHKLRIPPDFPGRHPQVREPADERVGHGPEHHGGRLGRRVGRNLDRAAVRALGRLFLGRGRRREPHQPVQELVDAVEQQRVAAEHRQHRAGLHAAADAQDDLLRRELLAGEILLEHGVVRFGHGLVNRGAQTVQPLAHVRHSDLHRLAAPVLVGLELQHVDVDVGLSVLDERYDDGAHGRAEIRLQILEDLVEIGALVAQAVHEENFRQVPPVGRGGGLLGAHGHALFAGDRNQRRVGRAHGLAHAALKVEQARRIQQVYLVVFPFERSRRRRHRRFAPDFLRVEIADGRPVADLSQPGRGAGKVQHGLRKAGLPRAAVARERDVQDSVGRIFFHGKQLLSGLKTAAIKEYNCSTFFKIIIACFYNYSLFPSRIQSGYYSFLFF